MFKVLKHAYGIRHYHIEDAYITLCKSTIYLESKCSTMFNPSDIVYVLRYDNSQVFYTRSSMIRLMHDTVTKLAYTSQNRVYVAYTNEILFGSVFRAYFPATGSSKLTMIIVNLI